VSQLKESDLGHLLQDHQKCPWASLDVYQEESSRHLECDHNLHVGETLWTCYSPSSQMTSVSSLLMIAIV